MVDKPVIKFWRYEKADTVPVLKRVGIRNMNPPVWVVQRM